MFDNFFRKIWKKKIYEKNSWSDLKLYFKNLTGKKLSKIKKLNFLVKSRLYFYFLPKILQFGGKNKWNVSKIKNLFFTPNQSHFFHEIYLRIEFSRQI